MYEESRRKKYPPTSEKKQPKGTGKIYYVVGGIAAFIFIAAAFFVSYQSQTIKIADMPTLEDCARTIEGFRDGSLEVIVCVRSDGTLILIWENLPEGTATIDIYRADEGTGEWGLWRSIPVSSTSGGVEIGIEGPGSFEYYFETKNEQGGSTWVSENAPQGSSGGGESGDEPTSDSGSDNNDSGDTPPLSSSPADDNNDTSPPSSPLSDEDQDEPPEEEGAYYTPEGEVVSSSSIDLGDFWVQHVNRRIEIGWKNLPAGTDKIVLDRSKTETGDYDQFLEITSPLSSDSIHLVDNTIHENYYYKMRALDGTSILEHYGPEFLIKLEE